MSTLLARHLGRCASSTSAEFAKLRNQQRLPIANPMHAAVSKRSITKVSALSLTSKKRKGHKITMVTAYDYPSSVHVARAGIDLILVGDSVAMVELGYETTQPIGMDDMLHHCATVKRGVDASNAEKVPLLVGDMPFGSYEFSDTDIALKNAYDFVKKAGMDAVKLEVRSDYFSSDQAKVRISSLTYLTNRFLWNFLRFLRATNGLNKIKIDFALIQIYTRNAHANSVT